MYDAKVIVSLKCDRCNCKISTEEDEYYEYCESCFEEMHDDLLDELAKDIIETISRDAAKDYIEFGLNASDEEKKYFFFGVRYAIDQALFAMSERHTDDFYSSHYKNLTNIIENINKRYTKIQDVVGPSIS